MDISKFDVKLAYRKLKSFIYYDNFDLFNRKNIADFESSNITNNQTSVFDFESNLDKNLDNIHSLIDNYKTNKKAFSKFFDKIRIRSLPKKITSKENKPIDNYYTNYQDINDFHVSRVLQFVDAPVEIMTISVLWIIKIGYVLEQKIANENYGNRLVIDDNTGQIKEGLRLFKPYYNQYQRWRNDAIDCAEHSLKSGIDVSIINLDVKDYFYNARINKSSLSKAIDYDNLSADLKNLHDLFIELQTKCTFKIVEFKYPNTCIQDIKTNLEFILPIGMPSSYILANWYLKSFDDRIVNLIKPISYGRYVDDIILVVRKTQVDNDILLCDKVDFDFSKYVGLNDKDKYILKELHPILDYVNAPECYNKNGTDQLFSIECEEYNHLFIQPDKVFLYHLRADSSTTFLDRVKTELIENSSEFRDAPAEEYEFPEFDEEVYHSIFSGKEVKQDRVIGFKNAKHILSVYLSKRIFAAINQKATPNADDSFKVTSFFKGKNSIQFYQLWERILTYYLVYKDSKSFVSFYKNTIAAILETNFKADGSKVNDIELRDNLLIYFKEAICLVYALDPKYFNDVLSKPCQEEAQRLEIEKICPDFLPVFPLSHYRISNMVRDKYVSQPLLNYTNLARNKYHNLIDILLPASSKLVDSDLDLDSFAVKYSPRIINFYEACIYAQYHSLLSKSEIETTYSIQTQLLLDKAFTVFYSVNYEKLYSDLQNQIQLEKHKNEIYHLLNLDTISTKSASDFSSDKEVVVSEITIPSTSSKTDSLKISLANIKCKDDYFFASLEGAPIINSSRLLTFFSILNQSNQENADLLVLPECSLPYSLVPMLANNSRRNDLSIIAGLEHWQVNNQSLNFIVTILPFRWEGIRDSFVIYRLKNHYSHEETTLVTSSGSCLNVPVPNPYAYHIFNWKRIYFTVFYCFELANTFHRSLFSSLVDLVVSSEWNSDTSYFSSIVEAASREIHCFFVQVNDSKYGDSRITSPSRTEIKNQLQIKGGENDTVLIGNISIKKLREFQYGKYSKQKENKDFKPTPPDFVLENVKKRIDNKNILK